MEAGDGGDTDEAAGFAGDGGAFDEERTAAEGWEDGERRRVCVAGAGGYGGFAGVVDGVGVVKAVGGRVGDERASAL